MKEILLARAFAGVGSPGGTGSSFVISTLSAAIGVAFLVLTLEVYDSYVAKLETVAFSVYPHILVFDTAPASGAAGAEPHDPVASELEDCDRICAGARIVNPDELLPSGGSGREVEVKRLAPIRAQAEQLADVRQVSPLILEERDLPVSFQRDGSEHSEVQTLRVLGVDFKQEILIPNVDLFLDPSILRESTARRPVLLSEELARSLFGDDRGAGQSLRVDPGGGAIELTVSGTFALGFHTISMNMLIAPLPIAQELVSMEGAASYFGMSVSNPYRAERAAEEVRRRLAPESLGASSWSSLASGDFESIRLFRWIIFLVLGMSFLIVGLTIRNTLTILTLERRRQIGILRALGLRDQSIRVLFSLIALSIGLVGAFLGLVAGSLLSRWFGGWLDRQLLDFIPVSGVTIELNLPAMAQVSLLMVATCLATALLSVNRALELEAVDCLEAE